MGSAVGFSSDRPQTPTLPPTVTRWHALTRSMVTNLSRKGSDVIATTTRSPLMRLLAESPCDTLPGTGMHRYPPSRTRVPHEATTRPWRMTRGRGGATRQSLRGSMDFVALYRITARHMGKLPVWHRVSRWKIERNLCNKWEDWSKQFTSVDSIESRPQSPSWTLRLAVIGPQGRRPRLSGGNRQQRQQHRQERHQRQATKTEWTVYPTRSCLPYFCT